MPLRGVNDEKGQTMKLHLCAASLAALALAGCGSHDIGLDTASPRTTSAGVTSAAADPGPAGAAGMPAADGAGYVRMAAAGDTFEIQSSQMILQSAPSDAVRRFAQMMVDHHMQTTAQLAAAAQAAGMSPPSPQLDARKAEMIARLQAVTGAARERLYVEQQVMAHEEALALHSGYAQSGDNAQLRQVAQAATPIVQGHLAEAQRLAAGSN